MPCWERNTLVYERLNIVPDLFEAAWKAAEEGLRAMGIRVLEVGREVLLVGSYGRLVRINKETGAVELDRVMQDAFNMVKREYSREVVKYVAKKGWMARRFRMKQDGQKIILQRR